MINIFIVEEFREKIASILGEEYSVNDSGVLLLNNNAVDFNNSRDLRGKLHENNIIFYSCAYCEDTENWATEYYRVYSHNRDEFFVSSNTIDNYNYCEDCQEYFDDTYDMYETQDGRNVCEDCRWDHYCECHDCGELVHCDNSYYCDDCDESFCDNCWQEHYHEENLLYDYHEFDDWRLHKTEEEPEPQFYIGHELEIDCGDNMEDAVRTINNIDGICMHDGSLSSRGIEFISHPLSYNYMLSQEENYRKAFEHLVNLGYKSHNTSTCGLHFHVTRPNDSKVIDRIILFMETYKEEIVKLSRRQGDELNRWSRFLSDKRTTTNPKVIKSLDYIVNNKDVSDRYMALNLTNARTIEFRFFKGTLKYETFMADFEFINNLVMFASDLNLPVEELTWELVVSKGRFLPQYINEHNLHSDKPVIDYSKETIIEFNEEKAQVRIAVDNLISEILKNISNRARQKNNTSDKLRNTYSYIYSSNEQLRSLQAMIYELENLSVFDFYKVDTLKRDLRIIKERLGK